MKKMLLFAASMMMGLGVSAQEGMSEGIHTSGTKILDAKNNELVMRGVNYSWAWQRGHEESVIPAAKRIGCNAIRIQLSTGLRKEQGRYEWERCTGEDLARLIQLCEENKLIAVFNTHDETGENDQWYLDQAVDFWIEMKDILNAHLETVIVNISNEWYGGHDKPWEWQAGYEKAIPAMREAGIRNMLLVDCAGWGQSPGSIIDKGTYVVESDPLGNMAFAVHFYDYAGADDWKVQSAIDGVLGIEKAVPLVIGEFSYNHKGNSVAYEKILSYCFQRHVGYLAWSWTDNGEGAEACDLFDKTQEGVWEGLHFAENGRRIIPAEVPYGIADTSKECSYFDDSVPVNAEDYNPFREGAANGDTNHGNTGGGNSGADDDYDPSVEEPLDEAGSTLVENETVIDEVNYDSGDWTTGPVHITKEVLGTVRKGDKIHLYITSGGDSQIQIAYKTPSRDWNEHTPYQDIPNWSQYDVEVNNDKASDFVRGLNYDGLYVNGKNIKLNRVAVTRRVPVISGVEDVDAATVMKGIDFSMPYEIYTLDGRRVGEMLPGTLYILRQNDVVVKQLAR